MGENYLVTPVVDPPDDLRSALGIHQSDIVLRTAIIAGIADLRANPDLLNYVFASLPKDGLTYKVYGEQQVDAAKEWFLNTEIPVFMNTRIDDTKIPCITVSIQSSSEIDTDLGDINYQTSEPVIGGKSHVWYKSQAIVSYEASTGIIVFVNQEMNLFPGMVVRATSGAEYIIQQVTDATTAVIDTYITDELNGCDIISQRTDTYTLESAGYKETFEVGCHVTGESLYLTYLWSVLIFILLRYKEELIEARGLERTSYTAGPIMLNTAFSISQPVFSRMTTVTGFVRQFWPKYLRTPVEGVQVMDRPSPFGYQEVNDPNYDPVPIYSDEVE